jgi:DNA-binding LacI/PurR family transcriptional regulator
MVERGSTEVAATLKDVAARAGVSIKTVSNVVNEHPYVTPATRDRVRRAIDSLGYRPNMVARRLRRGNVGVLALAIPDLANTYFSDIGNAIIAAAAAYECTILIDHTGGTRANESLVARGLRPHLIDGVILSPLALEMEDLLPHQEGDVPIVLLGERHFGAPRDHVVIDNVAAARLATTHLLSLGRRRIAAIGLPDDDTSHLRLRGFSEALAEAGQPVDPQCVIPVRPFRRAGGAQAMRHLLSLQQPPDAVFCYNDLLALGAIRALHEAGWHIPDDVAVTGWDDLEEGSFTTPSLTTISPDKAQIGRLAVSLLLDRIRGRRTGPPERFSPPFRLIVRESTAGAAAAQAAPQPASGTSDARASP